MLQQIKKIYRFYSEDQTFPCHHHHHHHQEKIFISSNNSVLFSVSQSLSINFSMFFWECQRCHCTSLLSHLNNVSLVKGQETCRVIYPFFPCLNQCASRGLAWVGITSKSQILARITASLELLFPSHSLTLSLIADFWFNATTFDCPHFWMKKVRAGKLCGFPRFHSKYNRELVSGLFYFKLSSFVWAPTY